MQGWIIYKSSANDVKPETYEIKRLMEEAEKQGVNVRVFTPEQFELIVTRDDRKSVMVGGEVLQLPDFVLPRMGAGTNYFALALIRHLERLGVRTFNSSQSIDTVKDKLFTLQILAEYNLPVPKTMLIRSKVDVDLVEKHLGFPVVVKTISGSQGSGVFLAETKSKFIDLLEMINAYKENATMILQEFVESSRGMDLRVLTIGGRVVAAMKRMSGNDSFKANYSRGGSVEPFEINPEIEWLALETARLLNLDIAGIDLLFDGDHYKICEANSSPGFEGLESCCRANIAEEIYNFLRVRLNVFE
ncbi:RimK family alpha-L-glutamate ligase [Paenibacillus macerans]|uniref:Alpha-L-glutamate ligase, RimK family protein n=1 Tax=Paenibacillus macerans TaxID=44252 RepID=A0A090ZGT4_PAEMA|nr:RimK family alpha-L-glutamate ligase [Paenibacillus macerans]KFN09450.1 alpha-L-glutamate ligase, RimK family protein [Paenibacillus macerans]MBS5912294.1 RimK family alpha-L-glutamate ligase [Paenibacillus macerans]MCY7557885.1 RimK family alpha-L-glutamate ligase [Paenibacillus macerans]MDU5946440.1 RimK family alpha-L-glutamate ligase [Paenibacillus macerans]MEC0140147.1 RimK family alpha-L-glutamate ligase [Paenibacillus macerans]